MTKTYTSADTALLLVDPYNDFLSEGGKLATYAKASLDATNTVEHMRQVVAAARKAGIKVFYVPHRRMKGDDARGWRYPSPYLEGGIAHQVFAVGTWGGEWHPDFIPQEGDVITKEHWNSSGFANTDLDVLLRQHGAQKVIAIGLLANTCIETTAKYAGELGYHVTLVRDATAAFSPEAMKSAHDINGPTYAHAIVTTAELVEALA